MKIGIVIVNYNKKDLLSNCLTSLKKINYTNSRVVVVDNGSEDGSLDLVRSCFPDVEIIKMGYNSGFCKANNAGIDNCLKSECEAILLLNNDTEVDPDFLEKMAGELDVQKKIGMVAAKVIFLKRKNVIDSAGLEITPDGLAKNRGLEESESFYDSEVEVFCPAGAAAFYSRKLLEDIEQDGCYFDENFKFYYEELDLGWRARLKGWKCLNAPKAIVYHHKSATSGAYSEFIAYHSNRNIFFNIIKNYPGWFMYKALFLSIFRYIFLFAGFIFGKGAGHKIKNRIGIRKIIEVTIKSLYDAVLKTRVMLKRRRIIQGAKTVDDTEVKRWFRELGLTFLRSIYK